jgi:outer membrane protein OmpA-like peptidoglycan-associated protein
MAAFAGSSDRLACLCTGEAALRSATVWGAGPYTADSGVCRAALHGGAIPITGGDISIAMAPGQASYAASLQNGVQTREFGAFRGSFDFEGPRNLQPGPPAQAPIAQALRRDGRVALYINFRTNSAELDPPALPLLTQLRDALLADAALRLRLVGHTDSQGGPALNGPLSQRRAQSVRAWLVQNGVAEARLAAEGRGQDQPIADNATDPGRALNRRVEAVRLD